MAEALAALSLVSAIIQLVDFSSKVYGRIRELQEDASNAPRVFQDVRNRIPLMVELLKNIKQRLDGGDYSIGSQETMLPVVESCFGQMKNLDKLLDKATSRPNESTFSRGRKAIYSVMRESDLERIDSGLRTNFDLLVQAATLQALSSSADRRSSSMSLQSLGSVSGSPPPYSESAWKRHYSEASFFAPPRPPPSVFMMPFSRDPNFLGRTDVIEALESRFLKQRQVALAGLGGVGKSQIAIEFSYRFHEKHPEAFVFWIYAGSRSRFEQGYQEIARKLDIPGWDDPRVDSLQVVCSWLSDEHSGEWLLVIDNADDSSLFFGDKSLSQDQNRDEAKPLIHYLPKPQRGSILITTRDKRVGERLSGRERPVEVLPMTVENAKRLLLSKMHIGNEQDFSEADAVKLISELAYLPLAITQAAAFITENVLTIADYLELLALGDLELQDLLSEDLEDPRRDLETENSVLRTWKLSFDQLLKGKPRAAQILSLMAVMDYHATPRMLLRDDGETEIGFRTALGALQAFSLISAGQSADSAYKMHRLVAISTQKWLDMQGTLSYWQQQALKRLTDTYPGSQTYENWPLLEALTPHAQIVFSFTFSTAVELLQCAKLLIFSALYDLGKGKYIEAHEKASKSMEIRQRLLPPDHQLTLDSLQTLGECQLHLSDLETAKATLQRAIAGREVCLGSLNPDTLESVSDLTITLLELDDVKAAEGTALRALEGRRKVLGEDHPDTLVSLNILAMVRQRQGDLEAASEEGLKVWTARKRILGEGHPDTLMTLNNLAVLRYRQGNFELAKTLLKEVLAGEERLLGPDCFDRQVSLTTLAFVLAAEGQLGESEQLHRKVLAIREKVYGMRHAATVYSMKNVAEVLEKEGKLDEAMALTAQAKIQLGSLTDARTPGALLTSGLLFD